MNIQDIPNGATKKLMTIIMALISFNLIVFDILYFALLLD
jgi:hypothetical protein